MADKKVVDVIKINQLSQSQLSEYCTETNHWQRKMKVVIISGPECSLTSGSFAFSMRSSQGLNK